LARRHLLGDVRFRKPRLSIGT